MYIAFSAWSLNILHHFYIINLYHKRELTKDIAYLLCVLTLQHLVPRYINFICIIKKKEKRELTQDTAQRL